MLITDNCKDIIMGSSAITQVMRGSTVVWINDPYPDVVWPSPFFEPRTHGDPKYGWYYNDWGVQFFVRTSGFSLPYYWAKGGDCEGEGGSDNGYKIYNSGSTLYSGDSYKYLKNQNPTTFTGTINSWFAAYELYDLILNTGGTLTTQQNSIGGMFLYYSRNSCGGAIDFSTDFENALSGITMLGGYEEYDFKTMDKYPRIQYLFCLHGTGNHIDLYNSTYWTGESMRFTVKYSPNVIFVVNDNSYWRGIIPWDMADYYNVKFFDRNGNRMYR